MARKNSFDVLTISEIIRRVTGWIVDVLIVVALAFSLTHLFGTPVTMQGSSMIPTLSSSDKLLLNRMKGRIIPISRYDIVAYQMPDEDGIFLKRVLALPGETVQITDGQVLINGEPLPESAYTMSLVYAGLASEPVTLKAGEYFVIGENADASLDSRFSDVGNIRKEQIWGTVWLRYSPFRNFRFIS